MTAGWPDRGQAVVEGGRGWSAFAKPRWGWKLPATTHPFRPIGTELQIAQQLGPMADAARVRQDVDLHGRRPPRRIAQPRRAHRGFGSTLQPRPPSRANARLLHPRPPRPRNRDATLAFACSWFVRLSCHLLWRFACLSQCVWIILPKEVADLVVTCLPRLSPLTAHCKKTKEFKG